MSQVRSSTLDLEDASLDPYAWHAYLTHWVEKQLVMYIYNLQRWHPRHFVDHTLGRSFSVCFPFLKGNEKGLKSTAVEKFLQWHPLIQLCRRSAALLFETFYAPTNKGHTRLETGVIEIYICEVRAVIAFWEPRRFSIRNLAKFSVNAVIDGGFFSLNKSNPQPQILGFL